MLVGQHFHAHVKGSIGEHCLWFHPYFSTSVPHVHLIWMGLEMGGRWPYSHCFVGCCFQDLFNIACSILVQFPSSFFFIYLVSIHVVHPYSRIDMAAAWKKLRFILSDRSDFHMIDNLSIAVHDFTSHILMSFSVDNKEKRSKCSHKISELKCWEAKQYRNWKVITCNTITVTWSFSQGKKKKKILSDET